MQGLRCTWRFMGSYKWGCGVPLRVPLKGSIGFRV